MKDYNDLTPLTADPVIIHWEDIVGVDNWNDSETVQPVECVTLGWLLEDSATMIVVASTYNYRDNEWATMHAFPKTDPRVEVV
jgi:hypothetical protein